MGGLLERDWYHLDPLVRVWWLASTDAPSSEIQSLGFHFVSSFDPWEMLLCELFLSLRDATFVFFKQIPRDATLWALFILEFFKNVHTFVGDTSVDGQAHYWVPGVSQWGDILIMLGCIGRVHCGGRRWTMESIGIALKALDGVCS